MVPFLVLPSPSFLLSLSLHPFLLPLFQRPTAGQWDPAAAGRERWGLGLARWGCQGQKGSQYWYSHRRGSDVGASLSPSKAVQWRPHTSCTPSPLHPLHLLLPCGSLWPCYSLALRGQDSRGLIKWYQVLAREKCPPPLFSLNSHQQQTVPPPSISHHWILLGHRAWEWALWSGCAWNSKNKPNVQGMPSLCSHICVSVTGFLHLCACVCTCMRLRKTATASKSVWGWGGGIVDILASWIALELYRASGTIQA